MITLRQLALATPPAGKADTSETIYQRFEREPECLLIPVVDDQHRPTGLIERNTFLLRLAKQYGRALFAARSVQIIMDTDPLVVEADTAPGDFASLALDGHSGQLLKGFIVVENGRYLGVGAAVDLLRAAATERLETASQLGELTESLKASHLEAERNRHFAEAVIEHIPSLVAVRSSNSGRFLLMNRASESILGVNRETFIGHRIDEIAPSRLMDQLRNADRLISQDAGTGRHRDLAYVRPSDNDHRVLRISQTPVDMPDGESLILTVADDLTDARRAQDRIQHLAHFDLLTALPNRALFQERLEMSLRQVDLARQRGALMDVAVLAVDLDRFKSVNDTLGHNAGDAVLRLVAERMKDVLRSDELASRLGGDEFAVLLCGEDVAETAKTVANRLTSVMSTPLELGDHSVSIGASIGIALYPQDADNAEELLKRADIALYRSKSEGKGVWRRFDATMHAELADRRSLENDLRRAVSNGDFKAHFQPILDLSQGRIVGFEALMRWPHERRGMVPPNDFIPLAEELGLINPMGEWMIRAACDAASLWPQDTSVAVNISAMQFKSPGLVSCIFQALSKSGLAPNRLELEVTETVLIDDEPEVLKCLRQLREIGVSIALDDFGTGFASLSYLQRFPFDKIKIDQSFTRGLPDSRAATSIISAVTALSAKLGLITTAEGVETEAQLQAVSRLGCTQAQGYLIGKATPHPEMLLRSATAGRLAAS